MKRVFQVVVQDNVVFIKRRKVMAKATLFCRACQVEVHLNQQDLNELARGETPDKVKCDCGYLKNSLGKKVTPPDAEN